MGGERSRRLLRGAIGVLVTAAAIGLAIADQEVARTPIVGAPAGTPGIGGGARFNDSP